MATLIVISITLSCQRSDPEKEKTKANKAPLQLTVAINAGEEGKAIGELVQSYPNAKVIIVELPYATLREKLAITLAAKRSTYDVVFLDDPWFPQLAPFLKPLEPLPINLMKDIIPSSLSLGRLPYGKGEIRALPFVGNCQLLFYRKDLLSKAEISNPPKTWDDLIKVAEEVSKKNPSVAGYCIRAKLGNPIVTNFLPILWSLGGDVFKDRGDPREVIIDSDAMRKALKIFKKLTTLSPPGAEAFGWSEMTTAFTSGKAALQLNWPAGVATIDKAMPFDSKGHRRWGVALPPSGRPGIPGTSMIGNWLLAVPSSSNNTTEAKNLILWLFDKQDQAALKGNPPTQRSVYDSLSKKEIPELFHYPTLRNALENSTPRPRTARWAQIEDALAIQISSVITGRIDIDTAVKRMQEEVVQIIK